MKTPQSPAPVAGDEPARPASEQPVEAGGVERDDLIQRASYMVGNPSAWDSYDDGASEIIRSLVAALSPASPARTPMGGEVEALREAENEICPHGDNVPADLEPGDTWVCPKCDAEWHTDDSQALAASSPSPAQGGEFDALEDWEHDDQRELSRLYRHRFDDSLQFNRGQMRTAIRHGRRIAALSASPQPEAGEAADWRSRPSAVHPLFLDIGHREIDWRHHKTKPSFDGDSLKPEWFDVQPLYLSAPAADDGWRDKAEGLESDLRSAVQVAWRRGAKEWARLNYPQWVEWLEASDALSQLEPSQ